MPPPPVESPLEAISNTPIIRLRNVVLADHVAVCLKLESLNPKEATMTARRYQSSKRPSGVATPSHA